ncbi:carbohydrate kinase family protein [Candidatus Woesearchaeota archaeon]|nr:carbohydrate kinase family protein [Candidatus Woesearchaeota archaeon]MBI2661632.1 carbohydrate kinase family protein [Candidatus Woesearchaeota archaeon]
MYDVITVGSATVDVFARTKFSELIKIIDPKGETDLLAFPSGSKILIEELDFTTGGGGTNTAVALSRLGHRAAFIGKLGKGTNSDFIHKELVKEKVALLCAHGSGNAGYSMILDNLEHDRTILTYKGINDQLQYREIPLKKLKTKWFYFCSMMGDSFNTLEKLAGFAEEHKIKILFNPSSYLAEKGRLHLKHILSSTEILVLNKEEAGLLVGKEPIEGLLFKLRALGPKIAVITDGRNEIYAMDGRFIYWAKPPAAKVVDTTGAGDAFASSFLSGIIKKDDVEFAMKLGIANSISVVTHHGAKNILLTLREATKSIKKLKIRVHRKKHD